MYISSKDGVAYLHNEWNIIFDDIEEITDYSKELLYIIANSISLTNIRVRLQKLNKDANMLEVNDSDFLKIISEDFDRLYKRTDWIVYGTLRGLRLSFTCTSNGKFTVGVPIAGLTDFKEKRVEDFILTIENKLLAGKEIL